MTNVHRLFKEAERRTEADDEAEDDRIAEILAEMDLRYKRKKHHIRGEDDMEAALTVLRWCAILGVAAILMSVAWQAKSKAAADVRMYETLQAIE